MEFCSSRLEMEYIGIISDVIINCRHQELVAKQRTLQLYRQLNILCVFTFDVHLLPSASIVTNTNETQNKNNKKLWSSERKPLKRIIMGYLTCAETKNH
jgi:hypothetical protein